MSEDPKLDYLLSIVRIAGLAETRSPERKPSKSHTL
jgi:hypothetical protein